MILGKSFIFPFSLQKVAHLPNFVCIFQIMVTGLSFQDCFYQLVTIDCFPLVSM